MYRRAPNRGPMAEAEAVVETNKQASQDDSRGRRMHTHAAPCSRLVGRQAGRRTGEWPVGAGTTAGFSNATQLGLVLGWAAGGRALARAGASCSTAYLFGSVVVF